MFSFKVHPCSRAYSHDWTECPFAHPGENARRRDPRKFHYSCVLCPDFPKGGVCQRGDMCEFAHGVFECYLHPAQYRTRQCKEGTSCIRRVCFFAHTPEELRPLYGSSSFGYAGSPAGLMSPWAVMDMAAAMNLNINLNIKWGVCSSAVDYDNLNVEIPTIGIVGSLVKSGVPVLVYSGDQGSVLPLIGSRTLVGKLAADLNLKTTVPYRVWFHGKQVGGWTQVYGKNELSFAMIRGASHEAPFSQLGRSLELFISFLEGRPLPKSF